jgi:hypothetical protein
MTNVSGKQPLKLDDLDGVTLRASDAFLAMGLFLNENAARLSPESALPTILSGIRIESDRMSGDPAALSDWLRSVEAVSSDRR